MALRRRPRRDLEQTRAAIEALRALTKVLEETVEADVWAMRELGARRIIGPCASGALRAELGRGWRPLWGRSGLVRREKLARTSLIR